ncbi:aromatic-ring-hydroxylating dioxygenase subunit beta [Pseudomonas synxantha]|uniref:aromatic-ring-hydroxylating dioxygenase subunit beta n=1 Tax=Pseudomonas TaxID=286 RepID=UPI00099D7BE6|nr:aromatic-ring-hydroxylating dioxygenase subunit beta [Pseudomonas synxantha]OPB05643.1 aromatic-ring-hydroxylating dioxygenase subunit beta [Pseudomonas synxantha]VCU67945.1 Biphenyl dioxygenase subunit beta [Pseudomonas synxantha]
MLNDGFLDISIEPIQPMLPDAQLTFQVEQFLFREASLLDERAFDGWLALWVENGRYWVPRAPDQASPHEHISIFWENAMLRETRVRRLLNERNWSQQPPTRTSRVVSNVCVLGRDVEGRLIVSSRLHVSEYRLDLRYLSGRVVHKLVESPEGFKIALKRVDLVNCDSVFTNIEVFP